MKLLSPLLILATVCALPACKKAQAPVDFGNRPHTGPALLGTLDCDPIVPTQCGFPFPSNVYLVDDATTVTKKHVAFGAHTLPLVFGNKPINPTPWTLSDGFSPGNAPTTEIIGATIAGLPDQNHIADSLDAASSPTILLDTSTGKLVPHFAELDVYTSDPAHAFMIRPVVRLKDATRYIVAIRHVLDASGHAIEATPVFKAFRDGTASTDPSVPPRQDLYQDIFSRLQAAGVGKTDLQVAWDYTTSSRENNTASMLKIRDEALATVAANPLQYATHYSDPSAGKRECYADHSCGGVRLNPPDASMIWKRIQGTFHVPLYTAQLAPPTLLNLGTDGLPKQNGYGDFTFTLQVPNKVHDRIAAGTGGGGGVLIQSHGLLGDQTEGEGGELGHLADFGGYVTIATDLVGFAAEDELTVEQIVAGDIGGFEKIVDRQHQGLLNTLLAVRMALTTMVNEPELQIAGPDGVTHSAIDPTQGAFYRGDSQGGIMGATIMSLSTDIKRGYLGEPGMPYSLLLYRSVDFSKYFNYIALAYPGAKDSWLVVNLIQMLWDRTEPDGYAPYITGVANEQGGAGATLPNTPAHQVLINVAMGDHQVSPLGAHILARAVGAQNLQRVNRHVFGLDGANEVASPLLAGQSGMCEFDFHLTPSPEVDKPPDENSSTYPASDDPHDKVREEPAVVQQSDTFLKTGVIQSYCSDGICDPD